MNTQVKVDANEKLRKKLRNDVMKWQNEEKKNLDKKKKSGGGGGGGPPELPPPPPLSF